MGKLELILSLIEGWLMVNDYQDWEYCSVHMSVQLDATRTLETTRTLEATESHVRDQLVSLRTTDVSEEASDTENLTTNGTLEHHVKREAIEVTSFDGHISLDVDFEDEIENTESFGDLMHGEGLKRARAVEHDQHDQHVDVDVFFPSLLLSFENLLNKVFEDLLNGLKNHNLYSMGLAQYLKLEDEHVEGNAVKLRYRLPIDNLKYVFEALTHHSVST